MIEDMVLQQTVMQMKHQQLLQQQLMEVRVEMIHADVYCKLFGHVTTVTSE